MRLVARAPGKVNLSLFVGAPRTDGLHPLVSVVQAVSLADELIMVSAGRDERVAAGDEPTIVSAERDEVVCPGIAGDNLAARALASFRAATGWGAPPQRLEIVKRVPVAAGMGGGSADAAATLRLAAHAAGGVPADTLHALAVELGADVPSQLSPGRVLMSGAGEWVEPLPEPAPFGLVIVPSDHALATADVYRTFDRLGGARSPAELAERTSRARAGEPPPPVNDLQDAARALHPPIDAALEAVRAAGARTAMVSGSGPTVFGVFDTFAAARAAAATLRGAIAAQPVGPEFGRVRAA
jgi:4-diphosphocytidyl-2-C-methyl-D-erythritol kinase